MKMGSQGSQGSCSGTEWPVLREGKLSRLTRLEKLSHLSRFGSPLNGLSASTVYT